MQQEDQCSKLKKIANEISMDKFSSREDLSSRIEQEGLSKQYTADALAYLLEHNEGSGNQDGWKGLLERELDFLGEINQFYWQQSDPTAFPEDFYLRAINLLTTLWQCEWSSLEDIRPILQGLYFSGHHSAALESLMRLTPTIEQRAISTDALGYILEFGVPFPQSENRELWEVIQRESSLTPSELGFLVLQRPEYAMEILEAHDFHEIWSEVQGWASHEFLSSLVIQTTRIRAIRLSNEISGETLTPDGTYDKFEEILTLDKTLIPLWYREIISKVQGKVDPYTVVAEDLSDVPKRAIQLTLLKKGFQKRKKNKIRIHNLGGSQIGHSGFVIEYGASKVLFDFGLSVTSSQFPSWIPSLEFLDAVCISHAHLDHLGGLPFLYRENEGLDCNWYGCPPTDKLARLLFLDNRNLSRKRMKRLPVFSHPTLSHCIKKENISRTLEAFYPLNVKKPTEVAPDVFVTAIPAGHIPGSVAYLIEAGDARILYTGDFNTDPSPLFPEPVDLPVDADVTIFDGTYFTGEQFTQVKGRETLVEVVASSERTIIPAFSVGRTQDVIKILSEAGLDKEKDIVTSGMAGKVCKIINLEGRYRVQPAYNYDSFVEGSVFVGGSGMLQGGISRELLDKTRNDSKTSVILCGYLAPRTLGSDLRNGLAKETYDQNVTYARLSAHTAPKMLNQFIDSLEGERYIVHMGALSGFKSPQDVSSVERAAHQKGLKIFDTRSTISLKV